MDALLSKARRFLGVFVLASLAYATLGYGNELNLRLLGNYQSGIFDDAAAEIADYDPLTQRVFVTNDGKARVDVLDISDPLNPVKVDEFDMTPYGAGVTSLSVHDNLVAIAVKADPVQEKGRLVIFTTTGDFVAVYYVGSLPDMVKFTPDGTRILVAIEGEPNDDYTVDPEGAINIIDISDGPENGTLYALLFSQYIQFNERARHLREQGIRIFGPDASPAQDFEPEYIAISPNSRRAYVTLQENNAIAVINIKHPGILDILPLGYKDHLLPNNSFDASNRDDGINLQNWPVLGMYLPDAIALYEVDGEWYLVTANEGDSRDYDGFSEEARVADVELDSAAFAAYPDLQSDENLGRLLITTTLGDEDGDGDFDKLYSFGGRSFSIWDTKGDLVYDSGNDFERILAEILPEDFNSNNDENDSADSRSDDKGPEPEALEIAQIGGRQYLFVGLERVGGVMIYDITNPAAPEYISYTNNRDFSVDFDPDEITPNELARVGDLGPEEIVYVPAHESPNGADLLIVANEVSGSVSLLEIETEPLQFPDVAAASSPEVIFQTGDGVEVRNGGFGSGMDAHPNTEGYFYLLTDRGPNFDGANSGEKVFPVADFSPQIGLFRLQGDSLQKVQTIHLKRADGTPITGLPNPVGFGGTGETPLDLDGNVLDFDEEGIDPEGVVALRDGTFWLSDEYGPHILHVNADGTTIERINPFGSGTGGRTLPKVFANRRANRGMEGMTITPDGKTLVGIMQSAMDNPASDRSNIRSNSRVTRIVTFDIETGETRQYIYLQEAPNLSNSEVKALSNTEFLVLERDGRFGGDADAPAQYKNIFKIDISKATDVSDPADGENGLLVDSKTLEQLTEGELYAAGIAPVRKRLVLDILDSVPGYAHDKPEGLALLKGNLLAIVNDDDFAISAVEGGIIQKVLPGNGEVDGNKIYFAPLDNLDEPFTFSLTVLHNNDGESQLIDAGAGRENFGGIARFKTLVDKLKGEANGGVVMLSSGDNYLAGPEFNASLQLPEDAPLYDAVAIGSIGYDALAIGNHEFDFGPDILARLIEDVEGDVPFVSANLDFSDEPNLKALVDAGRIVSHTVVETRGEKIGIVGATTPQLPFISSPRNVKVDSEVAMIVQQEVDALLADGIDKIILVSHLQSVTEDSSLAAELRGVDIMIAGGGDELLANDDDLLIPGDEQDISGPYPMLVANADGEEVPVVTTSGNYKYLGRLMVEFDDDGELISIADESGPVRVAGGANPDAVEADSTLLADVVEPINTSLAALASNVIGTSEVVLDGRRSSVRTRQTNEGSLVADALLWQAQQLAQSFGVPTPQVGLQNGGGIRNDNEVPAGDITELLTFDILPFSNFVCVVPDISAQQFKGILENAVSLVESVNGRFAQISGFKFEWDIDGAAQTLDADGNVVIPGSRVISVTLDDGTPIVEGGAVVSGAPAVSIATIDFLARGGDQYPYRGAEFTSIGVTYQKALANYIVDGLNGVISADQYPGEGDVEPETFALTILHNNDGESQLIDAGSGREDFGGVARFKTLVDELRSEAEAAGSAVLMLSSGDNYLAGPEFNSSLQLPADAPLYDAVAISRISYDALAIGNHEFDFGPDVLERLIKDVDGNIPFVSANLDFSGEPGLQALVDSGRIVSSKVVEKQGQKIGIIGATTPQLSYISSPRNVMVDSAVAAIVQSKVDAMTAEGIDKIVFISHLQSITEDSSLATRLRGVDVMIAGGGDELLADGNDLLIPGDESDVFDSYPKIVANADGVDVPLVTTSGNYKYVGRLQIVFDEDGKLVEIKDVSGPVRVAGGNNPDAVEADSLLQATVVVPLEASLASLASNIIGTSEVVLDGRRSSVRTMQTNEGSLVADALLWQAQQLAGSFGVPTPQVALQNGGGIRNDNEVQPGDISELLTFDILPFANFVSVVPDISAQQFKEILENAVSQIESVAGRFAQISGFEFEWDIDGAAQTLDGDGNVTSVGSRVLSVTLDDGTPIIEAGAVVDGAPAISVATIDFLARGGDQYPFRGADFTSVGVTYQRALANFITDELEGVISAEDYPVEDTSTSQLSKSGAEAADAALPTEFALNQNYPNPFNPGTTIRFALPKSEHVRLVVFDILGREVARLLDDTKPAGYHSIEFNASSLATGVYIYRLSAGSFTQTRKMLLTK